MSVPCRVVLHLCIFALLSIPAVRAQAAYYNEPVELVHRSVAVFKGFTTDPNMTWFRDNVRRAKGLFIVPQMLRGGFIVGGSGGRGLLVARDPDSGAWSSPAFYSMGSVSVGLQVGADSSEIILMIMTRKGLASMLSSGFKLGADVAVAAGPIGGSAKAQTADILAFGRSQGIYGGLSIEGAMINPLADWNRRYYQKAVLPADILIQQQVSNPQDQVLRNVLPSPGSRTKPLGR